MQIENELKVFKERLDPKIGAYFDRAIETAEKEDVFITDALRYSRKFVLAGGKRLRAAFMYYGYIGAGGKDEEAILTTSMSIELVHAFLLVHDDIIDNDDTRHGIATIHRHYTDIGKSLFANKDTRHFGESISIVIGDILGAFGNDIIFSSSFPLEQKFRALSKLQEIVSFTAIGQMKDIYIEYMGKASEMEILSMYRNKTAKYTIEGPLYLGALLAGASKELLEGFSAYALPLGIAFQIQDDILGIFGDAKRLGKPIGSDISEGKITLLVSRALRDGTLDERKRITEILGLGEQLTERDCQEFQSLIESTGALQGTKELASAYIDESKQALKNIEALLNPRAYDFLSSVAEYMMKREY
ncbi:MAG: polyprenyl synthetase family protein [Candidatus Moranbacteria bacterium]|nr:polyprenyl synthetase family protein [Candidatus Moranbacteria bacterium]MDD3965172.1 polyprenyl synthetase family protein [Candidatus Moranbacteria bacterium]